MHRLQFHYSLASDCSPARVGNPLMELLQAVAAEGSISAAARMLGLSYRHVWGELKRWEVVLGRELIVWEKGQSARLTEFADRLVRAEHQAQARLAPQIEALRNELERAYALALDDSAQVLTLYASHDDAVVSLREHALRLAGGPLHLDIRFAGSVDAVRALNDGRCLVAGFHTSPKPLAGSLAARAYKPLLQPGRHAIIGFAQRNQGLMVAPGNPLDIRDLRDVKRTGARLANREPGSGTRLLLDDLLAQAGLQATEINGYHTPAEPTHTAAAQAVANGAADVALGIELAAHLRGLDFVPLAVENYQFACLASALDQPAVVALRRLLQSPDWQHALAALAGYQPADCGTVLTLEKVLPWWRSR